MQTELAGQDVGICALGRVFLKKNPKSQITFKKESSLKNLESRRQEEGLQWILKSLTRFGRVGIFHDHQDEAMVENLKDSYQEGMSYTPKQMKRAEKKPVVTFFPFQLLRTMALEGWGESVEFRRIARKYLRPAKHHRCDTVFFPDPIFAEESTQKTLQHLAGTQIRVVTLGDILEYQLSTNNDQLSIIDRRSVDPSSKRKLIFDKAFTDAELRRAGEILRTKLPKEVERI